MAEPVPVGCHQGHPFGPYKVTVGHSACTCGGHRTYTCAECGDVVQWPETGPACDDGTFDGRARNRPVPGGVQPDMELAPIPRYEPPVDRARSTEDVPDDGAAEAWREWTGSLPDVDDPR